MNTNFFRQSLDFEEFRDFIHGRVADEGLIVSDREAREWYKDLDTDGDGKISMCEFFCFALAESALVA